MKRLSNINSVGRWVSLTLLVLGSLVGFAGWLLKDQDPSALLGLLGIVLGMYGVGEAANVGKRATWKKEAAEALK